MGDRIDIDVEFYPAEESNMLVFIDESGDPGFKFEQGSTTHFVLAAVLFFDDLDAEETALKIKRLRQQLSWPSDREFHFTQMRRELKLAFLQEVSECPFQVRSIVVDKQLITSKQLRTDKTSFHNYFIAKLLANSNGQIANARIRLDGQGDRAYKKAANTYLKKELNKSSSVVKNLKFVNSKKNSLIQLADMVAGAIYKSYQTERTDSREYIDQIRKRISDIWDFK